MRELEFRAWDEGSEVMHHNFQFIKSGEDGNDWICFVSDWQPLNSKLHPFQNPFFQQQFKIMQFTGLRDKNGVKVFEGDIVKAKGKDRRDEVTGQVIFSDGEYLVETTSHDWPVASVVVLECFEVIGNIYEQPELLEVGK